jgi:zinc protease
VLTRGFCGFCNEPSLSAAFSLAGVERHVLGNGLTVLLRRDRSAPVVAIVTWVKAGYFDEPDDVVGVSHVLEHMFFKGTPGRGVGEAARQTKASGGYLNAHTIYDHTAYFTVLPIGSLQKGLDIQCDCYSNMLLDHGELARELEVIVQEARRKADSAPSVAIESLYKLMHDRHRISRWRIGSEEGLRALTREQLAVFQKHYYRPGNTILSLVGDADPSHMLELVEQYYGNLPDAVVERDRGPLEEAPSGFRWREWEGDIKRVQLLFGWRTANALHPDTPALDLLSMVLASGRASRLYRNVRDAGLASSVSASNHTPVEIGVFGIHAEVDPAVVLPAAEAIWAELRNVLEFGVLHDEVHRAQRILQSSWLRRLESMDGQAMWLASWESLGGFRMGSEYFEKMMLLSPADVTDVARRYLHLEQMSVVAYRPRGTKAIAANAEEMFNLLNNAATTPQAVRTEHLPEPAVFSRKQPRLQQVCGPVRLFHSEGGVPILVRRAPGSPLFHASLHCMGGAGADSAAAAGLTLLAARAATKGTQRRTAEQIADEVESHGGSLGASVGSEGFGWSVSSPLQYRSTMTDILADVAQNAVFSERAVEAERAALLGEIALARDDMFRQPVRLAMEGAFGGHPYGRAVHGDEKTVARIGASDLHEWRTRRTQSGQFTLAAVADVEEEELAAELATAFAALQYTAAPGLDAPRWPGNEVHRA